MPKRIALPVFASDALSSVAYAPEEVFLMLSVAGVTAYALTPWIGLAVAAVMLVVVASYRQTILTALKDVEDMLVTVREGQLQYASQRQVLSNAERTFQLAESQYRAGATDLLTMLNAQQTLFSARDTFLQNTSAQLQNQVALFKALGGGFGEQG